MSHKYNKEDSIQNPNDFYFYPETYERIKRTDKGALDLFNKGIVVDFETLMMPKGDNDKLIIGPLNIKFPKQNKAPSPIDSLDVWVESSLSKGISPLHSITNNLKKRIISKESTGKELNDK